MRRSAALGMWVVVMAAACCLAGSGTALANAELIKLGMMLRFADHIFIDPESYRNGEGDTLTFQGIEWLSGAPENPCVFQRRVKNGDSWLVTKFDLTRMRQLFDVNPAPGIKMAQVTIYGRNIVCRRTASDAEVQLNEDAVRSLFNSFSDDDCEDLFVNKMPMSNVRGAVDALQAVNRLFCPAVKFRVPD